MRNMVSNFSKRRMEICELISLRDGHLDGKTVIEQYKINNRILSSDITYITDHIKGIEGKLTESTNTLSLTTNFSPENIYQFFLTNELCFKVLDYLFYYPNHTVDYCLKKLFISRSSLYRIIRKINSSLKKFHLQIRIVNYELVLVGLEMHIRSFYYQFFYEKFGMQSQVFIEDIPNDYQKLALLVHRMLNYQNDFAQLTKIKYIIGVNLKRISYDYQVEGVAYNELSQQIKEQIHSNQILNEMDLEPQNFDFAYDLNQLLFPFNLKNYPVKATDLELAHHRKLREIVKEALLPLLEKYEVDYQPNLLEHLTFKVYQAFILKDLMIDSHYILFNFYDYYGKEFMKNYPEFIHDVTSQFKCIFKRSQQKISSQSLDYMIFILLNEWTHILNHLNYLRQRTIKLQIISGYSLQNAKMLASNIAYIYKNLVEIEIYSDEELEYGYLEQSDADIILVNFSLPSIPNKTVLTIGRVLLEADIKHINTLIYQIIRESHLSYH